MKLLSNINICKISLLKSTNRSSKDSFDIIGKSINQGVNKINQEIRLMTIDEVLRKVWLPIPGHAGEKKNPDISFLCGFKAFH